MVGCCQMRVALVKLRKARFKLNSKLFNVIFDLIFLEAAVAAVALAAVSDHTLSGIGGEFHGGEPVKVNFQYFSIIQILCQMR